MASSTKLVGTGASDSSSGGDFAWSNPGNITLNDGSYAQCNLASSTSYYLVGTNPGFSIPAGSTIDGITIDINILTVSGASCDWWFVQTVQGGAIGGTNKATGSFNNSTFQTITFGSSTEKWGRTWTASDINNSGFGGAIAVQAGSNAVRVDSMTITVYYTETNNSNMFLFF